MVPPDTGICHQVNLEYLSRVVFTRDGPDGPLAYPDTLVGTDSHTPMVNGLGVLGWGVGGIEAEAAMLGQPMSMLIPQVRRLQADRRAAAKARPPPTSCSPSPSCCAATGVVGKFVEFYGPGVANVPLANRATIGNMSPEYGSTCAIFPIDDETLDYLRLTGRPEQQIALVEAYAKEQGLWHDPAHEPVYSPVDRARPGERRAVDRRTEAAAGPDPAGRRSQRGPRAARRPERRSRAVPVGLDQASRSRSRPATRSRSSHDHPGDEPAASRHGDDARELAVATRSR